MVNQACEPQAEQTHSFLHSSVYLLPVSNALWQACGGLWALLH